MVLRFRQWTARQRTALLSTEVLNSASPVLFFEFLLLVLVFLVSVDEIAADNEFQTAEDDHDVRASGCLRERECG
jgi:hypothetical protein